MSLQPRVALVVGAGDYIGAAIAKRFAAGGFTLAVGRRHAEKLEPGVEPAQGLALYVDPYLSVRHRDRPHKGCPLPSLSGDLARMPTAARKRFEAGTQRLTESIADVLRAMKHPNPDALAVSVLSEMVSAMAIARAVSNNERSEHILKAARDSIKARIGLVA